MSQSSGIHTDLLYLKGKEHIYITIAKHQISNPYCHVFYYFFPNI